MAPPPRALPLPTANQTSNRQLDRSLLQMFRWAPGPCPCRHTLQTPYRPQLQTPPMPRAGAARRKARLARRCRPSAGPRLPTLLITTTRRWPALPWLFASAWQSVRQPVLSLAARQLRRHRLSLHALWQHRLCRLRARVCLRRLQAVSHQHLRPNRNLLPRSLPPRHRPRPRPQRLLLYLQLNLLCLHLPHQRLLRPHLL